MTNDQNNKILMTKEDAKRIQSHADISGLNQDFKSRAQSASEKNFSQENNSEICKKCEELQNQIKISQDTIRQQEDTIRQQKNTIKQLYVKINELEEILSELDADYDDYE